MSSDWAEVTGIAAFRQQTEAILDPPLSTVEFAVRGPMVDWLKRTGEVTGVSMTDLLNQAIQMAGRWRLAARCGLQVVLRTEQTLDAPAYPLPALSAAFEPRTGDGLVIVSIRSATERWLTWTRGWEVSASTVAYDGVRLLGALAALPNGKLCITDGREGEWISPSTNLAGAPPLADVLD